MGAAALGAGVLRRVLNPRARYEVWERRPYREFEKKVLVVGGGFGGYAVVQTLARHLRRRDDVGVMMVSKENYFTFWPMVAGTISSDIDSINVAQPLRRSLIQAGTSFRRAELKSVDYENKTVTLDGGIRLPYDHLVLSLGAQPNFFGILGVEEHCLTMKSIGDAEKIRNRVIERFEDATLNGDVPDSRLTFVVIGGGSTGVETAAELHELITLALAPDYPNISLDRVKIMLLNRGPEILTELDPALRKAARARLHSQNVEVITAAAATEVKADRVVLKDGREIPSENVIWTAGARPNILCKHLGLPLTERDGIKVDEYLRVEGHRQVWALGDCAAIPDLRAGQNGHIIPPTAQAATQEGHALGKNLLAILDGREEDVRPFEYRPLGQLVELGSEFAVDEVMGFKISGLFAALLWRLTYLYKLESPRSKALIATDWIFGLFFKPVAAEIRRDE